MEIVSKVCKSRKYTYQEEIRILRTVEEGVGDEPARPDDFPARHIHIKRFAITTFDSIERYVVTLQLIRIDTLHISTMVLIEVGKLIVQKHRRWQVGRYFELQNASVLPGIIHIGVLRSTRIKA